MSPRRPGRRRRAAGLAGLGAAAALLLAACATGAGPSTAAGSGGTGAGRLSAAASNPMLDTGSSLGGRPAPGISLVNQFGQRMSLSDFRGKVVILAFVDSRCTNVCPLTTEGMVQAKRLLGAAGEAVQLLAVDANPRAITVADAMSYSRAHGMVNQWDFLTGSSAQLLAVWRAYHIAVQVQRGQIDHTPALYVIDQRGRERRVYLTQMSFASIGQSAQVMAREVGTLLPGHPAPHGGSLAFIAGWSPRSRVTLPGVPAGRVTLGPGRARLVVFFATWLAETSGLRAHLLALNRYAKAADRPGRLPALTAVDEGTTEPSAGAVAGYLGQLGKPLRYPVAEDATGRLADGYGVQDQPWFVLVSASGKVLWRHDGWLGTRALEAAARKG